MPGIFFEAVVKAVLLLGLETWVTTYRMDRALGGFQHRVDLLIIVRHPRRLQK